EIVLQIMQIFVAKQQQNKEQLKTSRPSSIIEVEPVSHLSTTIEVKPMLKITVNATAQKKIANEIKFEGTEKELAEELKKQEKQKKNTEKNESFVASECFIL
ncbi:33042_t:CDS:2, partial [Racocetra persica]